MPRSTRKPHRKQSTARAGISRSTSRKPDTAAAGIRLKAAQAALRASEERYQLVMRAVREGVYDWNIAEGTIHYSREVMEQTGSTRISTDPLEWRGRIHPEDRREYDRRLVEHFKGRTETFDCDYRYRSQDGAEWRWARQHGIAVRDKRGRAIRLIGSTGDITELKGIEQALKESEERLALATRAATEGIYEWNLTDDSLYLSDRAKAFFALAGDALTPAAWNARIHGDDFQGYRDAIAAYLKGATPHFEREYRIRNGAGGYSWVVDRALAVRDAAGRVTRLVGALTDVTQRKEAENELRRARDEANEALERQTATSDILKVISASPTDVQPVFEAIVRAAAHLFPKSNATIFMRDGELIRMHAVDGATVDEAMRRELASIYPIRFNPEVSTSARAMVERRINICLDTEAPGVAEHIRRAGRAGGFRSNTVVPLLREDEGIGTIVITHPQPGHRLNPKQLELLRTFADQAVIAIENVRLFNETKEALDRQTATAEILKVIAGSPTDVQPVFEVIVSRAVQLCGARFGRVYRYDGSMVHMASSHGLGELGMEAVQRVFPRPAGEDTIVGSVIARRKARLVTDVDADSTVPALSRQMMKALNTRSQATVPMLRAGEPIGAITMGWDAPDGFDDRQLELLRTFADQAAIAVENVRLFNETKEALEQQVATGGILRVITASPGDIKPVLRSVAENAARLCDAKDVLIRLVDGNMTRAVEHIGRIPVPQQLINRPINRNLIAGRAILEGRTIHVPDVNDPAIREEYPEAAFQSQSAGLYRTVLDVPMMRDGKAVGVIVIRREEVRPFSEQQIRLLQTFADQAVIAIDNARLFNETREALERQTATAEILRVITGSPTDVRPVFDTIAQRAASLTGASIGWVFTFDGEWIHAASWFGLNKQAIDGLLKSFPMRPGAGSYTARAIRDARVINVADALAESDPEYQTKSLAAVGGYRSVLCVPMLRDRQVVGALTVSRAEARRFSDKEVELLRTFAHQAVIAIENVRLFNETKEALEQQTATADILKAISSSPTDVQPVFDAIVRSGVRLFEHAAVAVARPDGNQFQLMAIAEHDPALSAKWKAAFPFPVDRRFMHGAAILDKAMVEMDDALAEDGRFVEGKRNFAATGYRAMTVVPMMKDGAAIGTISVVRVAPGPLSDKQKALLRTFADQAVIAIENVRLFNETKEALEQQKASADVLGAISSSIADTQPVFERILESCQRLFEGNLVGVTLATPDGRVELAGYKGENRERITGIYPMALSRESGTGSAILDAQVVHYPDVKPGTAPEQVVKGASALGFSSIIFAPMLFEGRGIGAIWVARKAPGPFGDKQISLLKTFADQAVIAIQNARLFNETKEALEQQKASADVLGAISSSIADASPVFDKILESCTRLFAGKLVGITTVGDDGLIYLRAYAGPNREAFQKIFPLSVDRNSGNGIVILDQRILHVPDVEAPGVPETVARGNRAAGTRAALFVPMMWQDRAIGAAFVAREAVGPFSEKEISLLKTFADQAVIAIQNARLFREIQDKSRQLEEASKHKSQFLASMSHELRTPLNAILGFNEMILGGIYGDVPGEMTEPLKDMQTSGRHLLRLINNVLDLAKIEAGRMELALGDYSVQDTVAGVHATLRPLAAEKGLDFHVEVPADIPIAHGDGGRITQCLMNLAGNSLKFTKQGRVAIGVEQANGVLRYSVTDTGIGIAPDKIASLFTEFKQTDATIASEFGGTGLGLSITKKFIEMHGGRIWVESEPGKGSAFRFEIPLRVDGVRS